MSWAEVAEFLLHGTRTAKIATVDAEGQPHVVPVWFTLDSHDVIFSTSSKSVKAKNMRREPKVALSVDDETPPFAFVSIRGNAHISQRPADFLAWTTQIAQRYVGAERAPEVGKMFTEIDDLVVRVRIDSYTAWDNIVE